MQSTGIRPARGRPHLQQLEIQSTEAYTCVLGPLAVILETGTIDRNQKADLSPTEAPVPDPDIANITPGAEWLQRVEPLGTRGCHIQI